MEAVFRIRYQAYRKAGYNRSDPSGQDQDRFDTDGRSLSFLVQQEKSLIGTMRLVWDSDLGLPMEGYGFTPYLEPFRKQQKKLAEVSKLAFLPEFSHTPRKMHLNLEKIVFTQARQEKVNVLFCACFANLARLYQKLLLFEPLTSETFHYLDLPGVVGLRLNLDTLEQRYKKKFSGKSLDLYSHFFQN